MKFLLKLSKFWTVTICLIFVFIPIYFGLLFGIQSPGIMNCIYGTLIVTTGYVIALLILMYRRKNGINKLKTHKYDN